MPSTTGKRSRTRPTRRDRISAREGSPRRAGSVADISTPIIVARAVSRRRTRVPGQGGAQDRVPGLGADEHRGAHERERHQHPDGRRGDDRAADRLDPDVVERERGQADAADGRAERSAARRATRTARAGPRRAACRARSTAGGGADRRARRRRRPGRARALAPVAARASRSRRRRPRGPRRSRAARRSARRARGRRRPSRARRSGSSARTRSASPSAAGSAAGTSRPSHAVAHHVAVADDVGGHDRRARTRTPR